jgi:nicotinate-nucleotide pyrophosphorylase (carboxylating)
MPDYVRFGPAEEAAAATLIELALAEDLGQGGKGDLTARAIIPSDAHGAARFAARSDGIVAGLPVVALLAGRIDGAIDWGPVLHDGDRALPGATLANISGPMQSLLALERTALNFLQRLSGIASLTARFVAAAAGTRAVILDTRKTTPGWRVLEKYAVRCGGGRNHRLGLHDAVLIKDNHLAWLARGPEPIATALLQARANTPPRTLVEIEVDSLQQLDKALALDRDRGPDVILLDNFGQDMLVEAVLRRDERRPGVLLEASGGVTLDSVRAIARTGVDRISVGALTHSAPALDIGLDFEPDELP